jgi:hypothetical protein
MAGLTVDPYKLTEAERYELHISCDINDYLRICMKRPKLATDESNGAGTI